MTNSLDVEKICRKYAFVPYQDKAYDPALGIVQDELDRWKNEHSSSSTESRLRQVRESLKNCKLDDSWTDYLNPFKKKNIEEIKDLAEKLLKMREEVEDYNKAVKEMYNEEAESFHLLESSFRKLDDLASSYRVGIKMLEESIIELEQGNAQYPNLDSYLDSIVRKKADEEGIELSEHQQEMIKNKLKTDSKRELEHKCSKYLKLKHDLGIIDNLESSYREVSKRIEQTLTVLEEMVRFTDDQVTAVNEILNTYDVITRKQILYLETGNLPEEFVQQVNMLSRSMREIDAKTNQRILRELFSGKKLIQTPDLDGMTSELAKEIRTTEEKND